ncbi:MAG TPA: TetR/AcrR family transcriptional regulator [Alphaproteobacteria bacterium]|jgi:AcrR family transcriptional regulator|nr:TetR/AcrR family transcriptional regulator [Alphaproteobacteria bacterium]
MNRNVAAPLHPLLAATQIEPPLSAVRRSPIQGRSQDKVQRILAATAMLADTMPLESITMMQIAEAAEASFSSIYRFFPSKDAILEAVAMSHLERLQKLYEIYFASATLDDGGKIIDDAIDVYVAFASREPGFRSLWINSSPNADYFRKSHNVSETAIQLARAYAVAKLGFVDGPALEVRLAVASNAATHILRYAFNQTEFPLDQVVAELKRLLRLALLGR